MANTAAWVQEQVRINLAVPNTVGYSHGNSTNVTTANTVNVTNVNVNNFNTNNAETSDLQTSNTANPVHSLSMLNITSNASAGNAATTAGQRAKTSGGQKAKKAGK